MKFEIHGEYANGTDDCFVVEADSIEEIRELAAAGVAERGMINPWSIEL